MRLHNAVRSWRWPGPIAIAAAMIGLSVSFADPRQSGMNIGRASIVVLLLGVIGLLGQLRTLLHEVKEAQKGPQKLREADYKIGYEDGHRDGRREARPVLVPFPRRDDETANVS